MQMNLNEFEDQVKLGFVPAEPSARVSQLIDERLLAIRRKKVARRRFSYAFAATAIAGVVLLVTPTVIAQAELRRLAGALDGVRSVVMTTETIDPDGTHHLSGSIAYLNGKWKTEFPGVGVTYFFDGTRYRLDRSINKFVVETGLEGPFAHNTKDMKLSSALGDINQWQPHSHVEIDKVELHGKLVTRATIDESVFHTRTVMFANIDTDLPIESLEEKKDGGGWKLIGDTKFDYSSKESPSDFAPDLKAYPPISKRDWETQLVCGMTSKVVGEVALDHGRLVIRSLDVAKDGTVFVTCQAGERIARWNRGYPIDITDNLGTQYAFVNIESKLDEEFIRNSKEGKLELCVFVPLTPIGEWKARSITVNARLEPNQHLNRHEFAMWGGKSGLINSYSWYVDKAKTVNVVDVASRTFSNPSVESFPTYCSSVDPFQFDNARHWEGQEDKARADLCRNTEKYGEERDWLNAALELANSEGIRNMIKSRLEELNEPGRPWSPK